MRLKLNLCDVDVWFKVNDWQKTESNEDEYDNWCNIELRIESKYINYDTGGEILTSDEVSYFERILGKLINGTLEADLSVEFLEPDLQFDLRIAKRLYDVPGKITYRNGYMDVDIDADFIIHFWCSDGLGDNKFSMNMNREELEALHLYLRYVTGMIDKNDSKIQSLLEKGLLLWE